MDEKHFAGFGQIPSAQHVVEFDGLTGRFVDAHDDPDARERIKR
jgi:hypothetical protein